MLLRCLAAAAMMVAALPVSAATMRAVVTGTILSDSRTVQPYDPESGISGAETTYTGPLAGATISIVYDYGIDAPVNDPAYDPATKHLSGNTEGQGNGMAAMVTIGRRSWSMAGYRGGSYRLGIDVFAQAPEKNASIYQLGVYSSPFGPVKDWTMDGITYGLFNSYAQDFTAVARDLSIPYALDRSFSTGTISGTGMFHFGYTIYADEAAGLRQVFTDRMNIAFRPDRLTVTRADMLAPVPLPASALLLAGPLAILGIRARRRR